VVLEWQKRDLDHKMKTLGPDSYESQQASVSLAKNYACSYQVDSAKAVLEQISPQDLLQGLGDDYILALNTIGYRSQDAEKSFEYYSLAIKWSKAFHVSVVDSWALSKYTDLSSYFLKNGENARALEFSCDIILFKHSMDQSYPAHALELDFFLLLLWNFEAFKLKPGGKASEYIHSLLQTRTTNDWFKNLLIMMDGELKYLEGRKSEAYHQHEQSYSWAIKNGSNSALYLDWPADFFHYHAQNCFWLGVILFEWWREREAIEKLIESLQSKNQAENVYWPNLDQYAILEHLFYWHSSPKDVLTLLGRDIGGLTGLSENGHPIQDTWWLSQFYDAYEHYYKLDMKEFWTSAIVVLESLRIDYSEICLIRWSIFDEFLCPVWNRQRHGAGQGN
jgi:hypothetical protein